jgi:guanylate kinase
VRRGTLIVLAGPSGVGKGSVVQRMRSRDPEGLVLSVSATTRPARAGEVDGVDYRFTNEAEFDRMIRDGELLEWAEVYPGRRYGTPRGFVDESLDRGVDVILEIDVQGAAQVRARDPDAVLILLSPPSFEALEERLRGRGTEDAAGLTERLAAAQRELEQAAWFDRVVVNDDVERATDQVAAIIEASRTR